MSYLVGNDSDVLVRCADADGRTWFKASTMTESREVVFRGCDLISQIEVQTEQVDHVPTYYWIGGRAGDWNNPANWMTNGVAGAGVPGAGSYAFCNDISILRTFHQTHLAWLDRQFADVPTLMASLKTSEQTHPYEPDVHEIVSTVEGNKLVFEVALALAQRVKVILNGRVIGTFAVEKGHVEGRVPAAACVAGKKHRNCLALIAYDGTGTVIARNYVLFNYVPKGFVLRIK